METHVKNALSNATDVMVPKTQIASNARTNSPTVKVCVQENVQKKDIHYYKINVNYAPSNV
jgi:hypothetical protein